MSELLPLVAFTVGTAALATLAILPFGLLLGRLLAHGRWPGRVVVETALSLPLVLPPTAVGLGLLLLLGRDGALGALDLAFTWRAVVVAAAVMAFPLLLRSVRDALAAVDPELVAVARTLGRSPWRAFWEVELPLAWRGVLSGIALAFARALGEFGATILVAGNIPGRTQTLALALYQHVETGRDAAAVRLAGVAVVLAFLLLWAADALARRRARRLDD